MITQKLSQYVKRYREQNDMTQLEFAEKCNVSVDDIVAIEGSDGSFDLLNVFHKVLVGMNMQFGDIFAASEYIPERKEREISQDELHSAVVVFRLLLSYHERMVCAARTADRLNGLVDIYSEALKLAIYMMEKDIYTTIPSIDDLPMKKVK